MAIYHLNMRNVSRKKGQNIIACAAYRSGEKISDYNTGECFDYTRKKNIVSTNLILPETADPVFDDREVFWNMVDRNEKRKDSRPGKEIEFALPNELPFEEAKKVAEGFLRQELVWKFGIAVDVSIHDNQGDKNKPHNRHVHALMNMRKIDGKKFGKKIRELDSRDFLLYMRERWKRYVNKALEKNGIDERVDHRSYKDQGKEDLPQIHEGWKARKLDKLRKGASERVNYNRRVRYYNLRHKRLNKEYDEAFDQIVVAKNKIYNELEKCAKLLDKKSVKQIQKPKGEVLDSLQKLIFAAKAGDQDAQYFLGWIAENKGMPKDWLFMDIFEKDAQMNKLGEDRY